MREMVGLSQSELDVRAYFPHGEVSKMERAQRAPGLLTLLRLADGLRVDPGILLDGLPTPQRTDSIAQAVPLVRANPGVSTATLADEISVSHTTRAPARRGRHPHPAATRLASSDRGQAGVRRLGLKGSSRSHVRCALRHYRRWVYPDHSEGNLR